MDNIKNNIFYKGAQKIKNYEIQKKTEQGTDVWLVCKKQVDEADKFGHFAWQGGNDQIVNPKPYDEFVYPVQFYKMNGSEYLPDMFELLDDYEIYLDSLNDKEPDLNGAVFLDWNFEREEDEPVQIVFIIYSPENVYGDFKLTVKHIESGKKIERIISVLPEGQVPSAKPTEVPPSVKPTEVPPETLRSKVFLLPFLSVTSKTLFVIVALTFSAPVTAYSI